VVSPEMEGVGDCRGGSRPTRRCIVTGVDADKAVKWGCVGRCRRRIGIVFVFVLGILGTIDNCGSKYGGNGWARSVWSLCRNDDGAGGRIDGSGISTDRVTACDWSQECSGGRDKWANKWVRLQYGFSIISVRDSTSDGQVGD
jgi:hypothetical protein